MECVCLWGAGRKRRWEEDEGNDFLGAFKWHTTGPLTLGHSVLASEPGKKLPHLPSSITIITSGVEGLWWTFTFSVYTCSLFLFFFTEGSSTLKGWPVFFHVLCCCESFYFAGAQFCAQTKRPRKKGETMSCDQRERGSLRSPGKKSDLNHV